MATYYVYLHITEDGIPFYIGKGINKRAFSINGRNNFWKRIVEKYGYDILIIEDGLTEIEAFEREIYWIKRIGRRDLGLGTLVNMTNGGEGSGGNFKKIEIKGIKYNSIKEASKILKINYKTLCKRLSIHNENKIDHANGERNKKSKKVIDLISGEIYDSLSIALKKKGLYDSYSKIRAQLNGQNKNKTNLKYLK